MNSCERIKAHGPLVFCSHMKHIKWYTYENHMWRVCLCIRTHYSSSFPPSIIIFMQSAVNVIQWSLTYPDPTYPDDSLIRMIHLSGHMFGNESPLFNRKCLTYPEIHLSGQSVWERRCPDKWGSTVLWFIFLYLS